MVVQPAPIRRPRPIWTLALTAIAFFMVALDALVVVTALPAIQRDLHASLSTLEWTVNAFTLAGGAVTQGLDWHWIFWVNVPIGVVATVLARLRLAETRGPVTRLDLPAATLVSGGAVAIVWGLIRSGDVGWGSAQVVASLIG